MATSKRLSILAMVLWLCAVYSVQVQAKAFVVINELHTDPDVKTELVEFIELHNYGSEAVDISGWSLTDGVFYTFPAQTVLSPVQRPGSPSSLARHSNIPVRPGL